MPDKPVIYVHTGEWPTPSPSIVFVTGAAYGLAAHAPVELIVRNHGGDATTDVFRSIMGRGMPDGLVITRIGFGGTTPGHTGFFRKAVERIGERVAAGGVAAVVTRNHGFLPYCLLIHRRWNIPCYFETHDFFTDLGFRDDIDKTLQVRRNSLFERMFFPRLAGLIHLTGPQRELFAKYHSKIPSVVARTGLTEPVDAKVKREKTVCYVGSLDDHKGVGFVLTALGMTGYNDLNLLVIGGKNEHEMQEFRQLATLAGVGGRVRISGWVSHSDVGALMDRCIAGVVPLADTAFNRSITSPLKILDCFARSLPVIGADLPSVREYVEDGRHGFLFRPGNPEDLAGALDRIAAEDIAESMRAAVREHADSFLWTARGRIILDFITRTGGGRTN